MAYPLPTGLEESCDGIFYCTAQWAYNVTQGSFWVMMLFAFVAILFIATQRFGNTRSFGFASGFGLLGAIWLATAQLMAWWTATIFILTGAVGIAAMLLNER